MTSGETVEAIYELLVGIGKKPAILRKEAPGFIGNRLQMALFREALYIVEQGIASPQDVDTVIKNSFGRRLALAGVFEIFEMAGWDLGLAVVANLQPHLASSPDPSPLLREKVARGELGVKTGKGFYEWTPESAQALRQRVAEGLSRIAQWTKVGADAGP